MPVQAIFIYSLPRSGSTLFQRILGAHTQVETASEPWLLLPLLSTYLDLKVQARRYPHRMALMAIEDFYNAMPGGRTAYLSELRNFVMSLYERFSHPETRYFVDKTPRYSPFTPQIIELFPDAKHIILWRNPVAVAASCAKTWKNDRWDLNAYYEELFHGLAGMIEAKKRYGDKVYTVKYEDLISEPEAVLRGVFGHLELNFEPTVIEAFQSTELKGRMGDPTGRFNYKMISEEPLSKWSHSIRNPIRKRWVRSYLQWIGKDNLSEMGYSLDQLLDEVENAPSSRSGIIGDILAGAYGKSVATIQKWGGYELVEKLYQLREQRKLTANK